jgi:hypothetical protein
MESALIRYALRVSIPLTLAVAGCEDHGGEPSRSDHDFVSEWQYSDPRLVQAATAMKPEWDSYCKLSRSVRAQTTLRAILAIRFRLSCGVPYPDNDADVCDYLAAAGVVHCEYALGRS